MHAATVACIGFCFPTYTCNLDPKHSGTSIDHQRLNKPHFACAQYCCDCVPQRSREVGWRCFQPTGPSNAPQVRDRPIPLHCVQLLYLLDIHSTYRRVKELILTIFNIHSCSPIVCNMIICFRGGWWAILPPLIIQKHFSSAAEYR